MPFDEKKVLEDCRDYVMKDSQLDDMQIFYAEDADIPDPSNRKKDAKPGKPSFCAYYEE